jgi:Subtilase family
MAGLPPRLLDYMGGFQMPQPFRNWYFEPDRVPPEAGGPRSDGIAPGIAYVPPASRQRHGARLLDPSDAPTIPGARQQGWGRTPSSTVYRARTLLIPADLLRDDAVVAAINAALAAVGMSIVLPDLDSRPVRSEGPAADALRRLPRIAGLVPAVPAAGRPAVPVVVDAWTALQTLRAAAEAPARTNDDDAANANAELTGAVLTTEIVGRIGLEHLLVGSAVSPNAFCEGNDIEVSGLGGVAVGAGAPAAALAGGAAGPNAISGTPFSEGSAVSGPAAGGSYVYGSGGTRAPVTLCLRAPDRREPDDLRCRRPVVAVLDTGVRAHPWLDVRRDPAGGYLVDPADGFVLDDPGIQAVVYAEASFAAAEQGDASRQLIADAWDGPAAGDPLLGELNDATGHGTFISGIVRQAAPDARVLSLRIMHSDDVVYEGDLLCALALLADRIAAAEDGGMAEMVDVVSLSLGYFDESAADVTYSSGLWQVIQVLLDLGVAVVAAAGNYSTSRRFYPAAFSLQPSPVPVISVGALNPNGSKALFSDGGRWVRAWAAGAAVVSSYPDDVNGSLTAQVRVRARRDGLGRGDGPPDDREGLDPDDFSGGFAVWSGTSFAAPLIAAQIAARLLEQAAELGLDAIGSQAAADRTMAALASLGWPGRA